MNQNTTIELITFDDEANSLLAFNEKMMDALTFGIQVECSPEEAEHSGAFREDALIEEDARQSSLDLLDAFTDEVMELS